MEKKKVLRNFDRNQLALDWVGLCGILLFEFFAIGDLSNSARSGRYKCEF